MKNIFLVLFITPLISLSQSNTLTESLNFYGEKISTDNVIDYDTFIENSKIVSKSKIEGTILSSCPKKGCWMQVKIDSDTIQVTFKDYYEYHALYHYLRIYNRQQVLLYLLHHRL